MAMLHKRVTQDYDRENCLLHNFFRDRFFFLQRFRYELPATYLSCEIPCINQVWKLTDVKSAQKRLLLRKSLALFGQVLKPGCGKQTLNDLP